jgi:hypothetical protein
MQAVILLFNQPNGENKMSKQTKAALLKEADDIAAQIDELKKNRQRIASDFENTNAEIQKQTEAIGRALLAGGNTSKDSEARLRNKDLQEDRAIALQDADFRLKELDRQYMDKQKKAVKVDFDALGDEACGLLLVCMDHLRVVVSDLDALDQKFQELNRVGAAAGMNSDHDDNLRLVRQICGYLMGNFNTTDGIPSRIKQVEEGYPLILAHARERVKK